MVCTANFKIIQCSSRFNFGDQDCETKISKFRQVEYCLIRITLPCLIFIFILFSGAYHYYRRRWSTNKRAEVRRDFHWKRKIYTLDTTVLLTLTQ